MCRSIILLSKITLNAGQSPIHSKNKVTKRAVEVELWGREWRKFENGGLGNRFGSIDS